MNGMTKSDQVCNCVRFAVDLLKAAGIRFLEPQLGPSENSSAASVLTPELFASYVTSAKASELNRYPETNSFTSDLKEQQYSK
jgi:hypothetical protein